MHPVVLLDVCAGAITETPAAVECVFRPSATTIRQPPSFAVGEGGSRSSTMSGQRPTVPPQQTGQANVRLSCRCNRRSLAQPEDAGAYLDLLLPAYKALPEDCIQKARYTIVCPPMSITHSAESGERGCLFFSVCAVASSRMTCNCAMGVLPCAPCTTVTAGLR